FQRTSRGHRSRTCARGHLPRQDRVHGLLLHVGALDVAALPLRPTHGHVLERHGAPVFAQPLYHRGLDRVWSLIMRLERPKLSLLDRLYVVQVAKGMAITLKHLFSKKITVQYPEEKPKIASNYRGMPVLVKDQHDRVKCVACQMCEFVCPPKAIKITPGFRKSGGADEHVEKEPERFDLDTLRCIYCGLC